MPPPPQRRGIPPKPAVVPIIPSCTLSSPIPLRKSNNLPDNSPRSIHMGRRSPSPSDESSLSRSPSTDLSSVTSSSGETSRGYEPHAPRECSESKPAWPQPSGPQYGMPFAPWVSWLPMQPAMPPFMPMMHMPVPYLPPVTPLKQARGPSDRTTQRENQRLRREAGRLQEELKRTRCPGAMPMPKRPKVNIGRKVTEKTQAEKQEDTIQRDSKWLGTSAPRLPQAPYKVQPGSLMVHLDKDVKVQPSQPYLNQQGAPLSWPQQPLRYGSYQPPTTQNLTEFQPLPHLPAPPPSTTGRVAPKAYACCACRIVTENDVASSA